MSYKATI